MSKALALEQCVDYYQHVQKMWHHRDTDKIRIIHQGLWQDKVKTYLVDYQKAYSHIKGAAGSDRFPNNFLYSVFTKERSTS